MSDWFLEHRINCKFRVKLGTYEMLSDACRGEAMKKSSVVEWRKLFKEGREDVEDDTRSGRSRSYRTDENFEEVQNLVHSNRSLNIRAMAVELSLKGLNFWPATRFSTMTMLQLTWLSLSSSFWSKNRLLKWNTHPIPLTWLRMTFDCFQK
jgi:hypothetical protein